MKKISKFLSEVMAELKKVSWPGKKEIIISTNIVITLSLIAGLYIFFVDSVFNYLINFVIR
ncbi:MAG: preprotein translocase subunit SecE [Candidatus Muiribacteriota bacterium]